MANETILRINLIFEIDMVTVFKQLRNIIYEIRNISLDY